MSDGSWTQVIEDYKFAQKVSWGEDFLWMEKLVLHLLENRDLSMLYPITSHFRLIAFIGKNFNERHEKPHLSIVQSHGAENKYRFKFSLMTRHKDGEFTRELIESVSCSFEKSLEVYDEMFEKLKAATEKDLTYR